jgi:acyl carrier protein
MLCELLVEEFGIEADEIVPEATFGALELDSLSMAELAVIVADQTGKDFTRLTDLGMDTTLAQAAAAFDAAPEAEPFVRTAPNPADQADPVDPAALSNSSTPSPASLAASSPAPSPAPSSVPSPVS